MSSGTHTGLLGFSESFASGVGVAEVVGDVKVADENRRMVQVSELSGFSQFKPANRAKSPSVEHNVSPCSIASAAKCASGTRSDFNPGADSSLARTPRRRSVG